MNAEERAVFSRSVRHAVEAHTGSALDSALIELGWDDALGTDPSDAVSILFALLGSEHGTCAALERLVAVSLGLDVGPATGLVLPATGRCDPPGQVEPNGLVVSGLRLAPPPGQASMWVVATSGHEFVAHLVPAGQLTLRSVAGMDQTAGLVEVSGTVRVDPDAGVVVTDQWPHTVALAQRAAGHEMVGAATKMLELARQHALDRVQFGQPISGFQAIRHRLAETLVAIESADAVLLAAWEDDTITTAAVAKALAGRAGRTAARHCQQVLAGVGFTTEHDFHLFARRTFVLDQLFGASKSLTAQFGAELVAGGRLPLFAPL